MATSERNRRDPHLLPIGFRREANSRQLFLLCAGLALLVFALYARTAENRFVTIDDDVYITKNILVNHGISLGRIIWVFSHNVAGHWHALTWISHMLDVEFFGLNPGAHHLVNTGFHAVNASLLLLLLFRLTGSLWCSLLAASLFALHPLRVESVAWAAERKDVLSGLFFLLTMLAYQNYTQRRSVPRYLLVAGLFVLGLLAKSMLVTLPFLLLVIDYWPLKRFAGPRVSFGLLFEKIPLLLITAVGAKLTIATQIDTLENYPLSMISFGARLANAVTSYAWYLWKFVWPTDLAVFYPHPALGSPDSYEPFGASFYGALLLLVGISIAALLLRGSRPYLVTGWLWFLGTLIPVIGLAQVGGQAHADRYTYLPMIGIAVMIAWGLRDAVSRWPAIRFPFAAAACATLLALSWLTWVQIGYWRDSETLFKRALDVTRNNYYAHACLAIGYQREGKAKQAIAHAMESIRIRPEYANAHHLLASQYEGQGRHDEALAEMKKAVKWAAWNPQYMCDLGSFYQARGRLVEARLMFERAIDAMPEYTRAYLQLGNLLIGTQDWELAERTYQRVLEFNPNHGQAHCGLGLARERLGDLDAAAVAYRKALESGGQCPAARAWFKQGRGR